MNPLLSRLQPYPFERLRQLFADVTPNAALRPISLGIGEPKHPTPAFIKESVTASLVGLASYPATTGVPALREACAGWLQRRYGISADPATQVLPVNGSREALFAFAQTVVDPTREPVVVCPDPFYQIYEGAALLAGAQPYYVASDPQRNFAVDWDAVPAGLPRPLILAGGLDAGNVAAAIRRLLEAGSDRVALFPVPAHSARSTVGILAREVLPQLTDVPAGPRR